MAVVGALLALAGSAIIAAALGSTPTTHPVIYAMFTTRTTFARGGRSSQVSELWVDPSRSAARLIFKASQIQVYDVRESRGDWISIGRRTDTEHWQRAPLASDQAPSLLTLVGVRASFARLKAASRTVTAVDLRHHLAYAFMAPTLVWPFPSSAPSTVWLDGVTGLPLQYRIILSAGKNRATAITTVDRLSEMPSTALPRDFFTPPDQHPSAVQELLQRVRDWLTGSR